MAKFSGEIGFSTQVETRAGVWEDQITERKYRGDIVRTSRTTQEADKVMPDVRVNNSIEIVADTFAHNAFFAMRYVRWAGALWTITEVEVRSPRLILRLGGTYNGPTA